MQYEHTYHTFAEFMYHVKHGERMLERYRCSSLTDGFEEWYGTASFNEALELLEKGWTKGINEMREVQKLLPSNLFDSIMPVREYRPELTHVTAGGAIDMGAYLSKATPEVFVREVISADASDIKLGSKLITLYINIANNYDFTHEAFMARGACTFALIEHLEQCGYSCELYATCYRRGMGGAGISSAMRIKIKEYGELLDTNKLCIMLCSTFALRRYIFAIDEMCTQQEIKDVGIGMGYGCVIPFATKDIILPDDRDNQVICVNITQERNKEETLKAFKAVLAKYIEQQQNK